MTCVSRQANQPSQTSKVHPSRMLNPSSNPLQYLLTIPLFVSSAFRSNRDQHIQQQQQARPDLVLSKLAKNETLYYFGFGSNMLRSKVESRGPTNASNIELLEMEPALVHGHRLAFNMRGFLPVEPAFAGLEPVLNNNNSSSSSNLSSKPLHSYCQPECHGSLIHVTAENYNAIMRSEGIQVDNHTDNNSTRRQRKRTGGYEEVIVTAVPYNASRPPVQAVALRVRPQSRWRHRDACPSPRYMDLLRKGAAELGLHPQYQEFLAQHPEQHSPVWLKRMAVWNLVAMFSMSSFLRSRLLSRFQNSVLALVYVPSSASRWRVTMSCVAMAVALMPGFVVGIMVLGLWKVTGKNGLPPIASRLLDRLNTTRAATN